MTETKTNILPIVGLTMKSVTRNGDDQITFTTIDGRQFCMDHNQDCCENVVIEDVCGDLDWLVGSPITQAEETSRDATGDEVGESGTWTFYRIGTAKGLVAIRWLGSSNGYYSERVDFREATK